MRAQPGAPPAGPQEVRGVAAALEAQQVCAEQALDDLPAPGKLGEDLIAGERDVGEVADAHVAAHRPEHRGHQLKLVIVHPDGRARGRLLSHGARVAPVNPDVDIPPRPVELRLRDHIVIQRPQRRVAEALVVIAHLVGGQPHADQVHAVGVERFRRLTRRSGPADPRAACFLHHRLESGHQAAGTGPPFSPAVGPLGPVHRQPAGGHHEAVVTGRGGRILVRRRACPLAV